MSDDLSNALIVLAWFAALMVWTHALGLYLASAWEFRDWRPWRW